MLEATFSEDPDFSIIRPGSVRNLLINEDHATSKAA